MTRVSRDVLPEALPDLHADPPRATVAFADNGVIDVLPARARLGGTRPLFGIAVAAAPDLSNREVVLVVDDGPFWFELRGISVRGVAAVTEPSADGVRWYAIVPRRVVAWDYGTLREE